MAKVLATEVRAGNLIEWDKRVWRVLKSYHVHVGGRGGAFMQVEMKDIESGTKSNQRFRTDEKIERAFVEGREMQYLYSDGDAYVFMDKENYEQMSVSGEQVGDGAKFLKDGESVDILFNGTEITGIELPITVELKVTETVPGVRGDSANAGTKPAVVETGASVNVPLFINEGDVVKIDTRTGDYIERVKS